MSIKEKEPTINEAVVLLLVLINAIILKMAFISNEALYWALFITIPSLLVTTYYLRYHKRTKINIDRRLKQKLTQHNYQQLN